MLTLSGWITTQVPPSSRAAADAKAARTGTAEQAEDPAAGTDAADQHVRLSQAGRELAATMGVPVEEEDEDIPQELRPMVKMIRELKKKIEEKLRELQEAMRSSDPGAKEARVPELQKELQQLELRPADGDGSDGIGHQGDGHQRPGADHEGHGQPVEGAGIHRPVVRAGRCAFRSPGRSAAG
ncbi:hypothetical protein [Pseudomonas aeruginosa]|uniref:hypothetical protein n=1 Tax=Pseudomonas aeruginosa TaxID=287 RepID=UPI003EDE86D7